MSSIGQEPTLELSAMTPASTVAETLKSDPQNPKPLRTPQLCGPRNALCLRMNGMLESSGCVCGRWFGMLRVNKLAKHVHVAKDHMMLVQCCQFNATLYYTIVMIACTSMLRDRYYSLSQTIWIWQNPGFLNPLPGWSEKLKVRRI